MLTTAIGASSASVALSSLISDPSFESYSGQLASNTGYGGTAFLGQGLASQTPWNYGVVGTSSAGGFQVAASGLNWGTVITAQSGSAFAIFQQACYAQQRLTGLIPGQY